jgi:hypothetical protein
VFSSIHSLAKVIISLAVSSFSGSSPELSRPPFLVKGFKILWGKVLAQQLVTAIWPAQPLLGPGIQPVLKSPLSCSGLPSRVTRQDGRGPDRLEMEAVQPFLGLDGQLRPTAVGRGRSFLQPGLSLGT